MLADIGHEDADLNQAARLGGWLDAEADTWLTQDCAEVAHLREASVTMLALVARIRREAAATVRAAAILREALAKEADGKSDLVFDVANALRALDP